MSERSRSPSMASAAASSNGNGEGEGAHMPAVTVEVIQPTPSAVSETESGHGDVSPKLPDVQQEVVEEAGATLADKVKDSIEGVGDKLAEIVAPVASAIAGLADNPFKGDEEASTGDKEHVDGDDAPADLPHPEAAVVEHEDENGEDRAVAESHIEQSEALNDEHAVIDKKKINEDDERRSGHDINQIGDDDVEHSVSLHHSVAGRNDENIVLDMDEQLRKADADADRHSFKEMAADAVSELADIGNTMARGAHETAAAAAAPIAAAERPASPAGSRALVRNRSSDAVAPAHNELSAGVGVSADKPKARRSSKMCHLL